MLPMFTSSLIQKSKAMNIVDARPLLEVSVPNRGVKKMNGGLIPIATFLLNGFSDQHSETSDVQAGDLRAVWQMAVTEERSRLAREIHDTLAQSFAGILLHTEALSTSLPLGRRRSMRALSSIQRLAQSGLDEARRSVQALRPKALERSTLPEALEQAAKCISAEGNLTCHFKQTGRPVELSSETQVELFRIAQEAMTNVRKHAHARSAWMTMQFKTNQMILTIRDDGVGMAASTSSGRPPGYGLATMRERAQRIGGQFHIESPAEGGTAVHVVVSLKGAQKASTI
jgi:signal transduction histidine kinase